MEELVQYFSQWGPVNAVVVAHNDSALIHTAMDRGQKQEERDIAVAAAAKEVAEEHDSTAALDQVGPGPRRTSQVGLSHPLLLPCLCSGSGWAAEACSGTSQPANPTLGSKTQKARLAVLDHLSCTCRWNAEA